MKKLRVLLLGLFVLCSLGGLYAAVCKDANGTKACGRACNQTGASCSCVGECTAEELEAIL